MGELQYWRVRAAEAERRRWARELHDDTLQELAAVRLGLARGARGTTVDELRGTIDRAGAELDGRIAALRALLADLRPAALDALGTASALDGLAARMGERGMAVQLSVDLDWEQGRAAVRHAPELEDTLFRLTQEALTNALRHGRAANATVTLVEAGGRVELTVRDDGQGFRARPPDGTAFGLVGMRERAELIGGRVWVASVPGAGTTVRAVLPVVRVRPATATVPEGAV